MKKTLSILAIFISTFAVAQTALDSIQSNPQTQVNAAQRILAGSINQGITIGGYAQIDYNQPEGGNGKMDVHRMVMLLGYKFNDKVQFITELEYEHVKEIYVEQAFLQYRLNENVNLRGGLMLVPMGIVNEYHEPTTFNGVERPGMDKSIVPTTWREIGFGVSGKFNEASLRYQAYLFNGFRSVNGSKVLGGSNGLRNGRQKGAESTINTPNLSAKLDFYGVPGLRLGLSGYFGKTQAEDDVQEEEGADVGIKMIGLDARYAYKRFSARGQFITASITDTEEYNTANDTNLGSKIQGWYAEAAYNLLPMNNEQKLNAFARYSNYDTHASVAGNLTRNLSYDRTVLTTGLSYHIAPGAVVKADYQFNGDETDADLANQLNIGLGVWF